MNTNWQPIETAPKDGTEIIVRCGPGRAQIGWYFRQTQGWFDANSKPIQPTHWMPLPLPPRRSE